MNGKGEIKCYWVKCKTRLPVSKMIWFTWKQTQGAATRHYACGEMCGLKILSQLLSEKVSEDKFLAREKEKELLSREKEKDAQQPQVQEQDNRVLKKLRLVR